MTGHRALARNDDIADALATPIPIGSRRTDGVTCRRCRVSIGWDDRSLCTWWPNGCTARPGTGPRPTACWGCCTEDERLDLVDAGCWEATMRVRGWR